MLPPGGLEIGKPNAATGCRNAEQCVAAAQLRCGDSNAAPLPGEVLHPGAGLPRRPQAQAQPVRHREPQVHLPRHRRAAVSRAGYCWSLSPGAPLCRGSGDGQ